MWHLQQMHRRAPELQLASPHPFRIPLNIAYLPSEADPVAGPPPRAAAPPLPSDHVANEDGNVAKFTTPGASPDVGSQEGAADSGAAAAPCAVSGQQKDNIQPAKSRPQVTHVVIAGD